MKTKSQVNTWVQPATEIPAQQAKNGATDSTKLNTN